MTWLERETAEQPEVLARLLDAQLPRLDALRAALDGVTGLTVAARGSSDNAARYAQYLLGSRLGLPVELAAPSVRTVYGRDVALGRRAVVAISQSGRSPDVVGALEAARAQGRPAIAITNDPGSPLAGAASLVLELGAGPERSVAATKTYTASLLAVALLAVALDPGPAPEDELRTVPAAVAAALDAPGVDEAAALLGRSDRAVTAGRGVNLSTAHEAALKLTELTGSLVAPFSPADLRHGPIGAVGPAVPALLVAPDEPASADVRAVAAELGARGVPLVTLGCGPGDVVVPLPDGPGWLSPLVAVVPAQRIATRLATARGVELDRPGGLAKVTETR